MNRRHLLSASAATLASSSSLAKALAPQPSPAPTLDLTRHRFGVNYTPSHNCWNDWNPDPIRRDLDAIAALGADHMRALAPHLLP